MEGKGVCRRGIKVSVEGIKGGREGGRGSWRRGKNQCNRNVRWPTSLPYSTNLFLILCQSVEKSKRELMHFNIF